MTSSAYRIASGFKTTLRSADRLWMGGRLSILFLLIAGVSGLPSSFANSISVCTEQNLKEILLQKRSEGFREIRDLIFGGYKKLSFWGFKRGSPEVYDFDRLVRASASLNEPERRVLLKWVKDHPLTSNLPHYATDDTRWIRLVLQDENEWMKYFDEFSQRGDHGYLSNELTPVLRSLSEELRSRLLQRVADRYPLASERKMMSGVSLPPKRAIDAFVRSALQGDKIILDRLAKISGKPSEAEVRSAYDSYLMRIQALLRGSGFGGHSSRDVLEVAKAVQRGIKRIREADKRELFSGERFAITLSGSFPNGFSRFPGSDLDVTPSHFFLRNNESFIRDEVNQVAKTRFGVDSIELGETHGLSDGEKARINPVLVKVYEDRIELKVYPPPKPKRYDANDSEDVRNVVFEGEPQTFILEASQR